MTAETIPARMWRLLRLHKHRWDQRMWAPDESGYVCLECGRIQYRKGPGGPPPPGTAFSP